MGRYCNRITFFSPSAKKKKVFIEEKKLDETLMIRDSLRNSVISSSQWIIPFFFSSAGFFSFVNRFFIQYKFWHLNCCHAIFRLKWISTRQITPYGEYSMFIVTLRVTSVLSIKEIQFSMISFLFFFVLVTRCSPLPFRDLVKEWIFTKKNIFRINVPLHDNNWID